MAEELTTNIDYNSLLRQVVAVIEKSRSILAMQICTMASNTYWNIGKILYEKKVESDYGEHIVERLSSDLKNMFQDFGCSPRNLWDMKKFYLRFCNSSEKLRQSVAVLPWSHILLLMRKLKNDDKAIAYYADEVVAKGWNRDLLLNAIKMQMYENQKSQTIDNNFSAALPVAQAQYANEVFHDSYNLGFLGVTEPILELELERRLVEKVKMFLMELGKGFTYLGNQYELTYNGKTSRVDMLFFHRGLRSLVAIDLKIGAFKPEYAGKMNYYLSLLDRLEKREDENNSIGIILCAEKDHVDVELALEGMSKPIGVADYQMIIPKEEIQKAITEEIASFEAEQKDKD